MTFGGWKSVTGWKGIEIGLNLSYFACNYVARGALFQVRAFLLKLQQAAALADFLRNL